MTSELPARARWLRPLVVVALIGGVIALARASGVEWSSESIGERVETLGVWGPVAFIAIVSMRQILLLPHMVVLPVGGALFGPVAGSLYGAVGLTISACTLFVIVRLMGADGLRRRLPGRIGPILERASGRGGVGVLAIANAYPFHTISVWHVGAALTPMRLLTFAAVVGVTSPVRAFAYAYFGDALAAGDRGQLFGAAGLLLLLVLPLAHPRVRAFLRSEFGGTSDEAEPERDASP